MQTTQLGNGWWVETEPSAAYAEGRWLATIPAGNGFSTTSPEVAAEQAVANAAYNRAECEAALSGCLDGKPIEWRDA